MTDIILTPLDRGAMSFDIIPFSSIVEGDRARQSKNYGDIDGLAESLRRLGSIQPIVLSLRNPVETAVDPAAAAFDLIAGGRRFRAMESLGVTKLYHGVTLDPARFGYLFAEEVPAHILREAELEENLQRLNMDWIDVCLSIHKVHRSKKDFDPKWGQEATGMLLGHNKSKVSYALRAAKALLAGDAEILSCTSLDGANVIFTKRAEDVAMAELQKRNVEHQVEKAKKTGELRAVVEIVATPTAPAIYSIGSLLDEPVTPVTNAPKVQVPLSTQFFLRDCILDPTPWPRCNHIVTDIPYGIDMSNINMDMLNPNFTADVEEEHDVASNISDMQIFLQKAYEAVKPGGFCVFFYDLDHHEKLIAWATAVGWKVQRWPYIACKLSYMPNQAPQFNLTKKHETCLFMRRDSQTVLRKNGQPSFGSYDFAAERKLYNNPFAKPFELWKFIYESIAFPGQTVLDPYCGEMSACRAAINCGLTPFGIEKVEQHFNRGIEHVRKAYALVHASNCEFI